eukprot:GHVP01047468.1.p1 GENE.GHVP01047468.1~~GHVP01047468.1.p1  ORF type:complete len:1596 (+),score=343.25 GHVP01047468.1:23-4810(+)
MEEENSVLEEIGTSKIDENGTKLNENEIPVNQVQEEQEVPVEGELEDEEVLNSEDGSEELDEDDLILIQENLGSSAMGTTAAPEEHSDGSSSASDEEGEFQFRRLKNVSRKDALPNKHETLREQPQTKKVSSIFPEEEAAEQFQEYGYEDQLDDQGWLDEVRGLRGLSTEHMGAIEDVFGDLDAVIEILKQHTSRPESGASPEIEDEHKKVAQDDEAIKQMPLAERVLHVDQPERLMYKFQCHPDTVTDEDLKNEAIWMFHSLETEFPGANFSAVALFDKYKALYGGNESLIPNLTSPSSVQELFIEAILKFLKLYFDYYEVPTIIDHHMHHLSPPLTKEMLWKMHSWDSDYWKLHEISKKVSKLAKTAKVEIIDPNVVPLWENFFNPETLEDCRAYVSSLVPSQSNESRTQSGRKRAGAKAVDTNKGIEKFNIQNNWENFLQTPSDFLKNLRGSIEDVELRDLPQTSVVEPRDLISVDPCRLVFPLEPEGHLCELLFGDSANLEFIPVVEPPEPPPLPSGAEGLYEWISTFCTGPLNTPERLYEALVVYESKRLSIHPGVRQQLRNVFRCACCISTVTTADGEASVDPSKSDWMAMRILRKPLHSFVKADVEAQQILPGEQTKQEIERINLLNESKKNAFKYFFLEIQRKVTSKHATMVIHPVTKDEGTPWKLENQNRFRNRLHKLENEDLKDMEIARFEESDKQDEEFQSRLLSILSRCYCGTRQQDDDPWGVLCDRIIRRMWEVELVPKFRKEIIDILVKRAESCVIDCCKKALKWNLKRLPIYQNESRRYFTENFSANFAKDDARGLSDVDSEDDSADEGEGVIYETAKVASFVVEVLTNGTRVHGVLVNRIGDLQKHIRLQNLLDIKVDQKRKDHDMLLLKDFLSTPPNIPDVVVVGASHSKSKDLYRTINTVLQDLQKSRVMRVSKGFQKDSEAYEDYTPLRYCSVEFARIFAKSSLVHPEVSSRLSPEAVQALSLARFAQYPMAEILQLWKSSTENHLLQLQLHHLQEFVPQDKLEIGYMDAAMECVCDVGLDLNKVKQRDHLNHLLRFIPGLGFKKVEAFLRKFRSHIILFRRQLTLEEDSSAPNKRPVQQSSTEGFGENFFTNSSSFFRIKNVNDEDGVDPIDNTRIHPVLSLPLLEEMASCILEQDGFVSQKQKQKNRNLDPISALFSNEILIKNVDVDNLAKKMAEKFNDPRIRPYVEMILEEIKNPYLDDRYEFSNPSKEELFYFFINDDYRSFSRGTYVTYRVTDTKALGTVSPSELRASIQDIKCFVDEEKKKLPLYEARSLNPGILLPPGKVMPARIAEIDYLGMSITVAVSSSGIKNILEEFYEPRILSPQNRSPLMVADYDFSARQGLHSSVEKKQEPTVVMRPVNHPHYRPCTHEDMLRFLTQPSIPCFLPSYRSEQQRDVEMYFKVSQNPFVYKMVHVQEHTANSNGPLEDLARKLSIGNEAYFDLDQVEAEFIQPLKLLLEEISNFRCGTPKHLKTVLSNQATEDSTLQWGLCIDANWNPSEPSVRFFITTFCDTKTNEKVAIEDVITVWTGGVTMWEHSERSFGRLVRWWKTEGFYKRNEYLKDRKRTSKERQY